LTLFTVFKIRYLSHNEYASYFADIRTYLENCARNGVNEFYALLTLTSGEPYAVAELFGGV
jgi:hypothetical protein